MNCKFDENLLYSYVDGTIDALEKIFLEEHIKYCEKCNKELNTIKLIDESLLSIENNTPERLSIISDLIVDNCLREIEAENFKVKISNYLQDVKTFSSIVINPVKMYYENPVEEFIKYNISKTANLTSKPIKHFINMNRPKFHLLKLLKVG